MRPVETLTLEDLRELERRRRVIIQSFQSRTALNRVQDRENEESRIKQEETSKRLKRLYSSDPTRLPESDLEILPSGSKRPRLFAVPEADIEVVDLCND